MLELDRITQDPQIMGGKACVRGMRVTVGMILGQIGAGHSIDEILAGYRSTSAGRPAGWWLLRSGGEPAGVLILTEMTEDGAWDLSYIGVVPEQRRRGIARVAVCHALQTAHAAGATQMLLAVDVRNDPARRLYAALGFTQTEMRDVYLYLLAARESG